MRWISLTSQVILVGLWCCKKNAIELVILTTNICFSEFWRLELRDQGVSMSKFWVRALWLVYRQWSSPRVFSWQEGKLSLIFLLIRTLISFMRTPPSWFHYFPKALLPNANMWIWEEHKHSVHSNRVIIIICFPCDLCV